MVEGEHSISFLQISISFHIIISLQSSFDHVLVVAPIVVFYKIYIYLKKKKRICLYANECDKLEHLTLTINGCHYLLCTALSKPDFSNCFMACIQC